MAVQELDSARALEWGVRILGERLKEYLHASDYYDGKHQLNFATEKFKNAFGPLFRAFADNLCPAVVNSVADKLRIVSFKSNQHNADNTDPIGEAILLWWNDNKMQRRAGQVHREALRAGDAYVVVWVDPQTNEPKIWPQKAREMAVHYAEYDREKIDYAVKVWVDEVSKRLRITLYFEDRIERYVSMKKVDVLGEWPRKATSYVPYLDDHVPEVERHNTGRVPVFHFANDADIGDFGVSELRNVYPLQDALNKSISDMLVAMEYVAMPQRYITGLEFSRDPETGQPIEPFAPGIGKVWAIGSPDATVGQFAQADLSQLLEVSSGFRLEVARVSGTPLHYLSMLTGTYPSGKALQTVEVRFTAKVEDRQLTFGDTWEDVVRAVFELSPSARKLLGANEQLAADQIETVWDDPISRDDAEFMDALTKKKALGVPEEELWAEMGYTPAKIEEWANTAASVIIPPPGDLAPGMPVNGQMPMNAPGAPQAGK